MMLNLTADEVQTLMINRGYAVGAGFESDALYIKLSKEWTRMQEEQAKQEIPAGFNEYDVESMGIDEVRQLAARNEFYGDDKIWQHEFCGTECDGSDH